MYVNYNIFLFLLGVSCFLNACSAQEIESNSLVREINYFNQIPPGETPELFAPRIFNAEKGYHGTIVFSPLGDKAYWTPMSGGWGEILFSKLGSDYWSEPQQETFGLDGEVSEPTFSPDGNSVFFLSTQAIHNETKKKRRIWYCDRTINGWSKAKLIDKEVYQHPTHWSFSVAKNGNLYFTSEINEQTTQQDIYVSKFDGKKYLEPEKMNSNINTGLQEWTPYISPDESYLIFSRADNSESDLYISVRNNQGTWDKATNLGSIINSEKHELGPKISPEGKYLFYLSNRTDKYQIYWVSTSLFDSLIQNSNE